LYLHAAIDHQYANTITTTNTVAAAALISNLQHFAAQASWHGAPAPVMPDFLGQHHDFKPHAPFQQILTCTVLINRSG